jgi:hypothetical protein
MKRNLVTYNAYRRKRYAEDSEYRESRKSKRMDYKQRNPDKAAESSFQRKIRVLSHYGPSGALQCCWKSCEVCDPDMLSLDHINNDGAKDRKARSSGDNMYRLLEQDGYPEGFQTLCYNHQWKKEILRRTESRVRKYSR